jgi:uncharacterized RDD family membrane protein YckC
MSAAGLDTLRSIATPEGAALSLRIAGPVTRARAWLFDALIRMVIYLVTVQVFAFFGLLGFGLMLVLLFALEWFYPVLFEVLNGGQTPGKRICQLVVLHDDGTPVGWGASFTRNTLRVVDFLPFMYAAAIITMLLNRDCKRLGDLAAATVVAYVVPADTRAGNSTDETAAEPPPFALTASEQRTLLEFQRRAPDLTEERAEEIAMAAGPLVQGLSPAAARRRLLRIANHLLGKT